MKKDNQGFWIVDIIKLMQGKLEYKYIERGPDGSIREIYLGDYKMRSHFYCG